VHPPSHPRRVFVSGPLVPRRGAVLAALLATAALLLSGRAFAAALPAEWKYVDAADDAEAAKLLPALLQKYDTPKKCADLVKLLRGKRPYPAGLPDQATLEHLCTDGKSRQFTYVLPKKFNPHKPTGVLVFLHGAISQKAPGGGAGEARLFGPAVESLGLIVIGPSTYDRVEWGDPACREHIHHALAYVKRSFNVDENRVFLAGDSDGGRGAFATAETEATHFASAVAVIGAPGGVTRFANLKNLSWLVINGEKDTTFPVDHVRPQIEGMKEAGIDLDWKLLEGVGHDPYQFTKRKDEVCAFFDKHPRDPLPKTVHLQVDPAKTGYEAGFPANTMRWVRIETVGQAEHEGTFDDDSAGVLQGSLPRVRAKREGNRITLDTRGVKTVTVLLSDAMVDIATDVEITVNGRLLHRGKPEVHARTVLEEARRFADRALVFHARVTLDVDGAEVAPPDAPAGK
jgi:dienelactone hydrolase